MIMLSLPWAHWAASDLQTGYFLNTVLF